MPAKNRATSATTNKAQTRADELRIDRLRRRAFCKGTELCSNDMRQWVETVKYKKPMPTVLDSRGNASAADKYPNQKYRAKRVCIFFWKALLRLEATLRSTFAIWVQRTRRLLLIKKRLQLQRKPLCYAPIGLVTNYSQEAPVSSMEEVD